MTPSGPPTDPDRVEMQKQQDSVFGEWKSTLERSQSRNTPSAAPATSVVRKPSFDLIPPRPTDIVPRGGSPDGAAVNPQAQSDAPPIFAEPTEVMITGFLPSQQPAALAFFETASRGLIYEDYDRAVANPRFAQSSLLAQTNARRAAASHAAQGGSGGLTQSTLRRINEYKGGDHWIKITFDSPQAAERAIEASPHVIGGCSVRAEMWHGVGPREDVAVPAEGRGTVGTLGRPSTAGRRTARGNRDFSSLPSRMGIPPVSANGLGDSTSSTETAGGSSNTANNSNDSSNTLDTSTSSATIMATGAEPNGAADAQLRQRTEASASMRKPKIKGARTLSLQPKESAILPVVPWRTQLIGSIPLIGSLIVGSSPPANALVEEKALPRKEDGSVNWNRASWGWWVYRLIDFLTGGDLCGIKGDE